MKTRLILYLVAAWCGLHLCAAFGANVYIRDGGSGSGAAWNDALDDLPASLTRGNTYYVADGSYAGYTFDDAVSGTTLITVRKATAGDHGTETGWDNAYGDGVATFNNFIFSTGFYTIDGVTGGGPNSWETGHGIEVTPSANNVNVIVVNASNITLEHVNAHVYPAGTAKGSMVNYFHTLKATAGSTTNLTLRYVWFHHMFGCALQMTPVNYVLIEYSKFNSNRSTAEEHSAGLACHGSSRVTIRWSWFHDIEGTAQLDGIEVGSMDYWDVYGNIFSWSQTWGGFGAVIACANDASNTILNNHWRVFNNTIVNGKGIPAMTWADPAGTDILVRNNVFFGNRLALGDPTAFVNYIYISGTGVSYSYNAYHQSAHPFAFSAGTGEAAINEGPNCKLSSVNTDPFTDWAAGDFTLTSDTTAGTSTDFTTDMFGNAYTSNGGWTRGAIAFNGSPPPTPPSNLSANAVSSSQINLTWDDNSADESGFKIEISTVGGGSGFSQIHTTAAGVESYSVTSLLPSTTYYFRVRAYNGNGNSIYTSEANATTDASSPPEGAPGGVALDTNYRRR